MLGVIEGLMLGSSLGLYDGFGEGWTEELGSSLGLDDGFGEGQLHGTHTQEFDKRKNVSNEKKICPVRPHLGQICRKTLE